MIARIEGGGMIPRRVAAVFAEVCFDEGRFVDMNTFGGQFIRHGFCGSFYLSGVMERYGQWWFKRRGRLWVFFRYDESMVMLGKRAAWGGHQYERHGDAPNQSVSYACGFLAGLPGKFDPSYRERAETHLYTEIEALLYD